MKMTRFALGMMIGLIPLTLAAQQRPGGAAGAPTSVGVVTVQTETVPYTVTLPGRAVAFQQANIRPRVEGLIEAIPYAPGRPVAIGDVLFRLERATYEANLASAQANVARAEAQETAAALSLARYQTLEGVGVTRADVETAEVTVLQAKADLKSADAALQVAQLQLDRTEIRSPIAGVADVSAVSVGAIVTANQSDALTTVTQLDPIYVDVSESSVRMLRTRDRISKGSLARGDKLDAALTLENGVIYDGEGELISPGTSVSASTGTLNFRIQFDNPDLLILPGQFLRVAMTLGSTRAVLVPQRATSRAANGDLTAFVARNGEAVEVMLTETGTYQNAWIVTDGIAAGDALIVDGLSNLDAGAKVTTVPVTIDPSGVVSETADVTTTPAKGSAAVSPALTAVTK